MKQIKLKAIFPNLAPDEYKVHFAKRAPDGTEPLDVYKKGMNEWEKWNSYSNSVDYLFIFPKTGMNPIPTCYKIVITIETEGDCPYETRNCR